MQKVTFNCENCEVSGSVRLPDDCDDYSVQFCPCCGDPLDMDFGDEDDE